MPLALYNGHTHISEHMHIQWNTAHIQAFIRGTHYIESFAGWVIYSLQWKFHNDDIFHLEMAGWISDSYCSLKPVWSGMGK